MEDNIRTQIKGAEEAKRKHKYKAVYECKESTVCSIQLVSLCDGRWSSYCQQFLIHGWEQRASVTQILPSLKSASPYLHIFPATPAVRFVTSCPSQSGSHQPVLQLLACAAPNCNLPLVAICDLQFMETDGKLGFLRESPVLDMQMPIT